LSKPIQTLTGLEKAAVLLLTLGPLDSAKVLQLIPEEEANHLARAIAKLNVVAPEQIEATLTEFSQLASTHQHYLIGGMECATRMLTEAYGPTTAQDLVQKLQKSIDKRGLNFDKFLKAEPQQLAKLIQDEHPQTVALILAHLDATQAATLLSCLPPEIRMDVAARIAELEQISPEIVRQIATTIDNKLKNLGEMSREACGGVRAVANIFNRLDPNTCSQLMDAFKEERPPLFENIRRLMFIFRDLENLDTKALSLIVARTPRTTLVVALKGANESLRKKFLATQSQRAADMLLEEVTSLGPVRLRDVDAAQQEIISVARELEREGAVSLSASDEQYVN
jgi:flagellar motor switch protein FliG